MPRKKTLLLNSLPLQSIKLLELRRAKLDQLIVILQNLTGLEGPHSNNVGNEKIILEIIDTQLHFSRNPLYHPCKRQNWVSLPQKSVILLLKTRVLICHNTWKNAM